MIEFFEDERVELYHLKEDPGETTDLAERERGKFEELYGDLRAWQEETGAPRVTEENPDYDPSAVRERGRDARGKGTGKEGLNRGGRGERGKKRKKI